MMFSKCLRRPSLLPEKYILRTVQILANVENVVCIFSNSSWLFPSTDLITSVMWRWTGCNKLLDNCPFPSYSSLSPLHNHEVQHEMWKIRPSALLLVIVFVLFVSPELTTHGY